ncbi:Reverse transcriptase from mobile element jockey protein [Ceratobasidium theobromae]|uniref:Reverse transcriptase from mobile element jockey protein n=1 Tax=Ceratobasidium theobromae TaxID=1582974 RepID=A0A5N5Q9T4_9AGAM|nr:Reverse transcriptase from mobile element jockey protein [Ceratobasidium theobromae]
MSAISNSQPPAPPVEIPLMRAGQRMKTIQAHLPPPLSPLVARSIRSAQVTGRALPAPSPDLKNASDQFLKETFKGFMLMNKEVKEKKHKKGLKVEAQGSPLIPVPKSYNPSWDPSPTPLKRSNPLFDDEKLVAQDIDITDAIPPADREVLIAPADPLYFPIPPPAALPGTERLTPAPHSPLLVEANDPVFIKKVVDLMLDIATKDILDRLTAPVVLDPPGDEKLAMPQIMACPYAKAGESSLTPVELTLWEALCAQISSFSDEVSEFMNSFNCSPHESTRKATASMAKLTLLAVFSWSGDDIALAMQAAAFATSGEFMSWEQVLQCAEDFNTAHREDATPPKNNALGLFVQPTAVAQTPAKPVTAQHAHTIQVTAQHTHAVQATTKTATTPAPPPAPPVRTWAKVAAPMATKPVLAKGGSMPILNTSVIQKELNQIKAQKMAPIETTSTKQDEEGWNVKGKGKRNKATPATNASLPTSVLPVRKVNINKNKQAPNLEVAFKPTSPINVDLVKARANQNESHSCLMRLLKHCNKLTASKEYKDKTDIRVKSFTYSRNRNCIAVFTPKTNIKEVELFAPGLCRVMGLKGAVTVQRTSRWTRMRVSHFPAWATDPDTGEWLERINSKEEILSVLKDFAPRDLLTKFPPVDVRFFKPDTIVSQCRPSGFETIVISIDDPTGEALAAYSNAHLSFGYRNSFVSTHTTCPKIAECKRCCSYQCPRPQACSAPMWCYKCGERHDPKNHNSRCSQCCTQKVADKPGHVCLWAPCCANCKGAHFFGDLLCPGRLKYAPAPPALITDKYTTGMNPPGGSPWSCISMRTLPTGLISPKVQINEDKAMPPAPQPPALAENGLISCEIMQVNVVKSNTRIHALLASPDYNNISILIVSDPWWGPIGTAKHDTNDQHRLLGAPANPLWRCFTPPIDTQSPGSPLSCIVYVRKDRGVAAEIDPLAPATPFFFVLDIFINGFLFKIIPVYLHGPKHAEAARALFQLPVVETLTLICRDFNIQHPDFFADWLLDSDLHVLNDLHRPTWESRVKGHAPSIIDFSIANGALFSMDILSDWDSSFAHSLDSDHAAIFFTIHAPRILEQPTRHYHYIIDPLMEDDWSAAFGQRVLELGLTGQVDMTQEVEALASGILGACTWATEAVMESHPTQKKAPWAPWWNEDCSTACSRVVKAKEEGLDREEIRAHTSHLWYCIRKAKRTFFDEICSTARPDNIWGINQWYRGRKSYGLPTLRKPDGTLTTTNTAKSEVLHSAFFLYTQGTPAGVSVETMPQHDELPFPPISRGEIAVNLASCSNKSAPGAHGTNYQVLWWAFAARGDLIEALYNTMLNLEYHPVCLKNALIAPIPKPNKFDFASPKAYRPISLLETLSKLFEKIMAARFTALSGLHELIPPEQFGGKDMTLCMDTGLSLIHDIENTWAKKKQVSVTLLDISGYFNNIDHGLLVKCMQRMGYPAQVLGWLTSYLSNQSASFRINDEVGSAFELKGRGIPQGSPLLPVFLSIFTALMLALLHSCGVQEGCIAGLLNGTCTTLDALADMGLSAECTKTELIHSAKSARDMTKNLPLILGDKAEDVVRGANTVRWLGFFLDRHLNFKDHVLRMATQAKCVLGGMRMLGNSLRGLLVYHTRMLVNACIIPILTYGFALWFHGRNSKTHCKTLQTVQNFACQWASGSFRTAPVAVVEHTIAMPPIAYRIHQQCANYSAKLCHLPSLSQVCTRLPQGFRTLTPGLASTARFSPINTLAAYTSPDAEAQTPYLLMPWEGVKQLGEDRLRVSMPSSDLSQRAGVATLYTDGACFSWDRTQHTGWGWCLMLGDSEIDHSGGALGPNHTSYNAECYAVADSIAQVSRLAEQTSLYLLHIISDNAGMLQGLLSSKPKGAPSSVDHTARDLCDLTSRHKSLDLLLSWCPAHHRVPGNEQADAIAKRHATTTPSLAFSVSTDRICWEAKERLLAEWKAHWLAFKNKHPNSMGTLAILNSPCLRLHPFHVVPGKRRKVHTQIIHTITGHGRHNAYLFRCGKIDSPECQCGHLKQDTAHIFTECPRHKHARSLLCGFSQQLDIAHMFSMVRGLKAVAEFLTVASVDI